MKLLVRTTPSVSDGVSGDDLDEVLDDVDTGKGRRVG
jgi:hypothetical protein